MNRVPVNIDNDNAEYEAFEVHQYKYDKENDTHKILLSFLQDLQ